MMANKPMTNRVGLEFGDPGFRPIGGYVLEAVFRLPLSFRETLFFGGSSLCLPLQKLLYRSLGGRFLVRANFTKGPLASHHFECWSSEKYFILGSDVEKNLQQSAAKFIKQGNIVYDIGAHVGYMALLFSALVGSNGHVFAFEPSTVNFPRLKRNLELNPTARITPIQAAVSEKLGTMRFLENGCMSSLADAETNGSNAGICVRTLPLDDFVCVAGNPAPDVVKIDTEGHAGPCLCGMQKILREHRPLLVLEVHSDVETLQVRSILERSGYSLEGIDALDRFPRHIVATSP